MEGAAGVQKEGGEEERKVGNKEVLHLLAQHPVKGNKHDESEVEH